MRRQGWHSQVAWVGEGGSAMSVRQLLLLCGFTAGASGSPPAVPLLHVPHVHFNSLKNVVWLGANESFAKSHCTSNIRFLVQAKVTENGCISLAGSQA